MKTGRIKKTKKQKQALLIEEVRLMLVCPAKAEFLPGKKTISTTVVNSNYRYCGEGQRTLWTWLDLFDKAKLNFEDELRKLVKMELGNNFDIRKKSSSGYLGVTSNTWIEIYKQR
jgi:phage-related protein